MHRNLIEMWRFRSLIAALVRRHLNSRYRGSFFGFLWSFLNPLLLIATYSLVFKYYIRFSEVENYPLFLFTGLLPWIWFSSSLIESSASISSGGSLITKAMFPPHVLPVVSVLTNLANFVFAIPLIFVYAIYCSHPIGWQVLALPVVIVFQLVFLLGWGLFFSALNVYFRDVQHILANLMTFLFFLCPIIYPIAVIPDKFKFTFWLNPVSIYTEMYHLVLFESKLPTLDMFIYSGAIALFSFILGNLVFNYYREGFAEMV